MIAQRESLAVFSSAAGRRFPTRLERLREPRFRELSSFAVALNWGMGFNSLNADVEAFARLQNRSRLEFLALRFKVQIMHAPRGLRADLVSFELGHTPTITMGGDGECGSAWESKLVRMGVADHSFAPS